MSAECCCGMFAVGTCRTCGQALCGLHGTHNAGGDFVCVRHLQEAAAEDAVERARRNADAQRSAERYRAQARQAREAAAPGFPPEGPASAADLSAALRQLVPSHAREYIIARRSLGRTTKVRGWGFVRSSTPKTNHIGGSYYRHEGLIIADDGQAWEVAEDSQAKSWVPSDYQEFGHRPRQASRVGADDVQRILAAVLQWTGKRLQFEAEKGPTPARMAHVEMLVAEGRLSAEEAERLAPGGVVGSEAWEAIREL